MQMVLGTYVVRWIEAADRAANAREVARARANGDDELVQIVTSSFAEWEKEQGHRRERLVCAVCESSWLTPTAIGAARPHRRDASVGPSWDRVRRLRQDIQVLQAELDRVLDLLETEGEVVRLPESGG
jgi:hypothetical protein